MKGNWSIQGVTSNKDSGTVEVFYYNIDTGVSVQVDLRLIEDRKIIVEAENLSTGNPKGFFLDDEALTANITLPKGGD